MSPDLVLLPRVELERIDAELAALRAVVRRALATEPTTGDPLIPADLIPVGVAAKEIGRSKDCVRQWAEKYKLGKLFGGRWVISRSLLRSFLENPTAYGYRRSKTRFVGT